MPTINIELILWVVFGCWHYSLFCGYISDDHAAVAQRKDIIPDDEKKDRGESFWVKRFNDGIVLFYMNQILWKLGCKNIPFVWHCISLGVHVANTYLLYLFLYPLIGEQAVYAVAIWAVSPMLNQNVVWISGRPYSIGLFLALVAMICWQDPITFCLFYGLAVITNISIIFVPIILAMYYWEWQTQLYLAFMVCAAFPWLVWKFNKRFTKGLVIDRDNFAFKPRKLNTFARIVDYYVTSLFVPTRMGWYHQAGFRYNEKWEKFNYITLLGYATILFFATKQAGWWFILGILPCANLYATNSFLVDRYLYFPSIGVAMLMAPYLHQYPAAFLVAMTFYVTRSYMYSRHLKNDEKLYRENVRNHPKSDYAYNNLVYFLIQQHRYDEARIYCQHGIDINRSNKMLWYNMGITFAAQGHFGNDEGKMKFIRALDCFKMALQIEPRWSKPADDMKRLIKLLVDNKVLTMNPQEATGHEVAIPNLTGLKEMFNGSPNEPQQIAGTQSPEASSTAGGFVTAQTEKTIFTPGEPSLEVS